MSLTAETNLTTGIPDVTWTHRALPAIVEAIPVSCKSLLDVGCGRGIVGALCRIYRSVDRLVGMDGFEPYLEFSQKAGFYDESMLRNLRDVPLPLNTQEFEVVTCIEVIEHLERDDGRKLLAELERIGSRVIVTTPNVFFQQHEYDGNSLQRHLSRWTSSDFESRGYTVYGTGSLNIGYGLRNVVDKAVRRSSQDFVPDPLRKLARQVSEILGPITRNIPRLSTNLLCVREPRQR
jgi:methyltransferase family protein